MKTLKWMALPLLALAFTSSLIACSSSDDTEDSGNKGNEGVVFSSEQQKERLSQIGKEFLNSIPASDFNELDELGNYIADTYCNKDSKTEDVEKWADKCFKALIDEVLDPKTSGDDYYKSIYNYTRRTYKLSQFRAHLTWNSSKNKWEVQEGTSDLKATCKDKNGQTVTATLTTSGKTTKVYAGEIELDDDYNYNWWYDDYGYYHSQSTYTSETDIAYVEVPEVVNIKLTRGGQTLVSVQVKTDLSSLSGQNFDLSKSAFTVSVSAQLAGYDIQCDRVSAKANTENGIVSKVTILKNGKKLLSAEVSATANVSGSGMVWSENADEKAIEKNLENTTGNVSVCNFDILGQLQISATCSDIKKIAEYMEEAEDARYNEATVNNYVQKINNLAAVKFYYDGNNTLQGNIELEAVPRQGHSGTKYEIEPVVVFADGSRYNMINESYFNESNFKSLINLGESLFDRYEDMTEKYD